MSEQKTLKDSLISAFELLRDQAGLIYSMEWELSALKRVAFDRRPESVVRFGEFLVAEQQTLIAKMTAASKVYDALISELKNEARWIN